MPDDRMLPPGAYLLLPSTAERGALMGMPYPSEEVLASLPDLGIGLVVSLLEARHMTYAIDAGLPLRLAHFAIDDGEAPADVHFARVAQLCAFMHHYRLQGSEHGIAVHCLGGQGRTGLLLVCYRAYLATTRKGDAEGSPPTDTAAAIERQLTSLAGRFTMGAKPVQLKWAKRFYARLANEFNPAWEETAMREIRWQRAQTTDAFSGVISWTCPSCGARAIFDQVDAIRPCWCPTCGRA